MMEAKDYFKLHEKEIIEDMKHLVMAASPSLNKELADQCKDVLQGLFKSYFGKKAQEMVMEEVGNHLKFTYGSASGQVLLVGHYDTVWEPGAVEYREVSDKIYGPGILDMKASLISAIWFLKYINHFNIPLKKKIVLFINSDEEIGSKASRPFLEVEAAKSQAAFILEPPVVGTGALKTARKGTSKYLLKLQGTSAHAGNNPQEGVSAIKEAAKQILDIEGLTDYDKGTTLNVGLVQGGGKLNVVPNEAHLGVDVRAATKEEQRKIDEYFEQLEPHDDRIKIEVEGGINRPPMERTQQTEMLFDIAREEAEHLGLSLHEAKVGGGSDGNFTAPIVRTLDGLGLVGDGIHAEYEHIEKEHIAERFALLTNTVLEVMDEC